MLNREDASEVEGTLALLPPRPASAPALPPLPPAPLETESGFYAPYRWCLDAYPPVRRVRTRLIGELAALDTADEGWQRREVASNVFLLACALADSVDDYLAGEEYDFSPAVALLPALRPLARLLDGLRAPLRRWRDWRLRRLHQWRARWGEALGAVLEAWLGGRGGAPAAGPETQAALDSLLARHALPPPLLSRRVKAPAAFRTQDLAPQDVWELADRFTAAFPEREPLLVVGLRTAGSYFAPLLRAALRVRGYADVECVTLRPKKGIAPWERAVLRSCVARGGRAVLVDEPADTGSTVAQVVAVLRGLGLPPERVVALLPVHATRRAWRSDDEALPLAGVRVIALEPEEYYKYRRLEREEVEGRLRPYFRARGYTSVALPPSAAADDFNRQLKSGSDEKFHTRLKRVYEVRLGREQGGEETRYVLAKSVGWGWLSYHAFLAGEALAEFVPPLLGLREGILYQEWLPRGAGAGGDRQALVRRLGSYVAARVRFLGLGEDPGPGLDAQSQKGWTLLAGVLSRAHGGKPAAVLRRAGIRSQLARRPCPFPTLIDGRMRRPEWVRGPISLLKTDFEHHGMGKTELNVTDPAYDLADALLHFALSPPEEEALLAVYRAATGDEGVEGRLFLNKLLAGTAALIAALDNLKDPRLGHRHAEANRTYIEAWDFLTAHAARFCGRRCGRPAAPTWGSPLVVMDVDGVLDKQIFGFPSTTAAGIRALASLHGHGVSVALNTARTLDEVQEYSRDYGCVGGVAEYGSVAWDGVTGRKRILVTPESRHQLHRLAAVLRRLPGVFLNERYEHSLRAYTYEHGRTAPLPAPLVQGLVADLGLDRLRVHQTYLDTAVLAREVDKGQGLRALLALAGQEGVETIAIGDSEPDLAMFAVAGRSFAPGHISGRKVAALLGCRIADRPYQAGLLRAVRSLLHPAGGRCPLCHRRPKPDGLFPDLLEAADRPPLASLARALADPRSLRAFVR